MCMNPFVADSSYRRLTSFFTNAAATAVKNKRYLQNALNLHQKLGFMIGKSMEANFACVLYKADVGLKNKAVNGPYRKNKHKGSNQGRKALVMTIIYSFLIKSESTL